MSAPQTVATVVVFDYLYDYSGKALAGSRVHATLQYSLAVNASPQVSIEPLKLTTETDSNGYWQFNLVPNPNLNPTGTTYVIRTPFNSFEVSVPTGPGPYQATAIVTTSPIPLGVTTGSASIGGTLTVAGDAIFKSGRPWIDAVAFGADPTGTSDSTTAIQSAINAGGSTFPVFIPAGTYLITSTLTASFKEGRIMGAGMGMTNLRSTAAANPVLQFSQTSGSGDTLYSLENLTMNGGSAGNGATAISLLVGASQGAFRSVEIINYALGITNGTNSAFGNLYERCLIHANTVGVNLSLGSQNSTFRDCLIFSNTQNQAIIGDASHQCPGPIMFSGCNIQATTTAVTQSNLLLRNCDELIIDACYSETNTTTGSMDVEIAASTILTPRVTIRNCRFLSNGANTSVTIDSGTTGAILLLQGNRHFTYGGTVIVDSGTTSNVRRICNTENSTFINDSFNGTALVYP